MKNRVTYTLQIAMYYFVRVKEVEAIRHVPQLRNLTFRGDGDSGNRSTHQVDAIHLRVLSHIFGNPAVFHPVADDLEGWRYVGGNS